MWSRLSLVVLGLFWVVMTVLLWRSEYGTTDFSSTPLAPDLVWEKILTSPDSSSLAILHRGERIGFCHLISSVSDQYNTLSVSNAPEGLVRSIEGYTLDMSGTLGSDDGSLRVRFDGQLELTQSQDWKRFRLQILNRPTIITLEGTREEGFLLVDVEGADVSFTRQIAFDELGDPEAVLRKILGPTGPLLLNAMPFGVQLPPTTNQSPSLEWKATADRMEIGQSTTHIYRLELNPMEGLSVVILVSRAGEILRVVLPDNVLLINEALTSL